jgi:hypothetical protein
MCRTGCDKERLPRRAGLSGERSVATNVESLLTTGAVLHSLPHEAEDRLAYPHPHRRFPQRIHRSRVDLVPDEPAAPMRHGAELGEATDGLLCRYGVFSTCLK